MNFELEVCFFESFEYKIMEMLGLLYCYDNTRKKSCDVFGHVTYSGEGVAFLVAKWLEFWNKPRSGYKNQLSISILYGV